MDVECRTLRSGGNWIWELCVGRGDLGRGWVLQGFAVFIALTIALKLIWLGSGTKLMCFLTLTEVRGLPSLAVDLGMSKVMGLPLRILVLT